MTANRFIVTLLNVSIVPLKEKCISPLRGLTHKQALQTQTQLYQKMAFPSVFPKLWKSVPTLNILAAFQNSNSNQKYE